MNSQRSHFLGIKGLALVLLLVALLAYWALSRIDIDVFPDPSPVLVTIVAELHGMGPEDMERFITYPLERSLAGLPRLKKTTSVSTFGLSSINAYFEEGVDIYFARQLVSQQLAGIESSLPPDVEGPRLTPVTSALGMVYIYALEGAMSSMDLRSVQDWLVKFQLQVVPGVAAVFSHGGEIRQMQVQIDPDRLQQYGISLHETIAAIRASSHTVTAGIMKRGDEEILVRGLGLVGNSRELAGIVLRSRQGTPLLLGDVAEIGEGPAINRGDAILDGKTGAVSGIVMKLIGANTAELITRLDSRIEQLNRTLPQGLRIVPVYNQALIIRSAFKTVMEALLMGIFLVALILLLFINDLSSALVAAFSIPFAVAVALVVMKLTGTSADLMSLGGLAIGIGIFVDASIVVVDSIARKRDQGRLNITLVNSALKEIRRPLLYAMGIIVCSFVPILALQGTEGKMFWPFGLTLLSALLAAVAFSLWLAPGLMLKLPRISFKLGGRIFAALQRPYMRLYDLSFGHQRLTLSFFGLCLLLALGLFINSGSEFIPRLNEQTLQLEVILPQSTSIETTLETMTGVHRQLHALPEVERVYSRVGRGEAGDHAHSVNEGYAMVMATEREHWQVDDWEGLVDAVRQAAIKAAPSAVINVTQPIKHNLDHLLTGVRADVAVKLFGDDLGVLMPIARQLEELLKPMAGVADLQISRVSGQNALMVRLRRDELARHGLMAEEVLEQMEIGLGGKTVSRIYQGDQIIDVFVRFNLEARKDAADIGNMLLDGPNGRSISLAEVAVINEEEGFASIQRENGKRYLTVQFNTSGRDVAGIVAEAEKRIAEKIDLPLGVILEWGGQYELKRQAERRLWTVLLLTFAVMIWALYRYLSGWRLLALIAINLIVALAGGMMALRLAGVYLSIPSSIGFAALVGITLENSLILIECIRDSLRQGLSRAAALRAAVEIRLRPILMTKFTTMIGLLPLLLSSGVGSEIQRPLALVVMGGIFFSIFTTLLLLPVMLDRGRTELEHSRSVP